MGKILAWPSKDNYMIAHPKIRRYITSTKFDSRNKVPYSGLLRLLSQALQQILSEAEEEVCQFFNHLKAWLGAQFTNISILADMIPELKSLLVACGHEDVHIDTEISTKTDNAEARLRFHNLYVEVFRAVSHWRMVTIVSCNRVCNQS